MKFCFHCLLYCCHNSNKSKDLAKIFESKTFFVYDKCNRRKKHFCSLFLLSSHLLILISLSLVMFCFFHFSEAHLPALPIANKSPLFLRAALLTGDDGPFEGVGKAVWPHPLHEITILHVIVLTISTSAPPVTKFKSAIETTGCTRIVEATSRGPSSATVSGGGYCALNCHVLRRLAD